MITCTRKLWFSCGHRVLGHENKCAHIHGHNYEVHLIATAESLDSLGRVVDFSVLKSCVGGWLDDKWDHGMLIYKLDEDLCQVFRREELIFHKRFLCDFNPTVEEMAKYLLSICPNLLKFTGCRVISVKLFETPNCWAEASIGP